MQLEFTTISAQGLVPTAGLLTRAFADYFVKIPFAEETLRQMERQDGVDLASSLVLKLEAEPVGAALIARRGSVSRLAGMALVPEVRRRGLGRVLLERLIADARARADRRMVLEVIGQNTAAILLYEEAGFVKKRRLVGFAGRAPTALEPVAELQDASMSDIAAALNRMDPAGDWPWQISGCTVARLPAPACGYTLDRAWVALQNPAGPVVGLRALAVDDPVHAAGRTARLLHAVMARHPGKEWRFSALWPEEHAEWFNGTGLARQELTQWQMALEL